MLCILQVHGTSVTQISRTFGQLNDHIGIKPLQIKKRFEKQAI